MEVWETPPAQLAGYEGLERRAKKLGGLIVDCIHVEQNLFDRFVDRQVS